MNTHWFIALIALCCPAMTLAAPNETAVVAPVDAISFLKQHDAEVQAILAEATADTLPPALRENIKGHINAAFDFPELSRLALGAHWQERTPEDRDHFIQTFSGIIEEQNFDSFVQYYREGKITYESAERDGDATVVVAKVPLQREEIEIVYKLHQVQKAWRVYDIVIDGVSTAEGNRRRYARYIEKKGYEKLIAQLDKQLARLRQTRN